MAGKKKVGAITIARRIVQILALLLFAVPMLVAGWGALGIDFGGALEALESKVATPADGALFGSFSASTIFGVQVMDPFAFLQTVCASKSFDVAWLIAALIPFVIYGLIRGRVFCGWICPVNLVCEIVDWLRGKLKIQVREMPVPRIVKPILAAVVLVLSALASLPVFELFSPVGFLTKFLAFGSLAGLWTLVCIIVAELFWGRRVWCRSLCPLGGFWQVVGKVGILAVKVDHDKCTGCGACKKACLCDPEILQPAISGEKRAVCSGDCMLCGKCLDACNFDALSIRPGR